VVSNSEFLGVVIGLLYRLGDPFHVLYYLQHPVNPPVYPVILSSCLKFRLGVKIDFE
jgi:hypothetical protein